jgi:hypothetical protein
MMQIFDRSGLSPEDITALLDAAVVAWKAAKPKTRKVRFEWRGWAFVSTLSSFAIQVDTPTGYPVAERFGCPDDF